ncbi:MAG TPA: carboxypeptidase regulatory-like domain-containing protein [Gaiellaceae bacterium]
MRRPGGRGPAGLTALLVLAALLASGALAAAGPSSGPAGGDEPFSLADGVEVPALGDPAGGDAGGEAANVEGDVVHALREEGTVPVIVRLREQADIPAVAARARAEGRARGRAARVGAVVDELRRTAAATQPPVRTLLRSEEAAGRARQIRSFWIFNGFAATVGEAALDRLARHPAVESIALDEELSVPPVQSSPRLPTWGLEKVNAPRAWGDHGFTGEGVVVGVMDTGVDGGHPALRDKFRGRDGDTGSSWYVPTGENYPEPGDGHGHGTHVTGTIVGGPPGEVVGVAPDADWIAVKIFRDTGSTSTSIIHDGFQWMLAPGGDPARAPHVVNNSWGSTATNSTEFLEDVRAWVAAGIFPAFANGNNGPVAGTVGSPASFPESFGVGATDINDQIASFSSRGPAIWDGVPHVKPQVSAPGHQIFSTWPRQLGMDYHTISGTSMATPHLTGVVALLLSAQPGLTVDAIRDTLTASARSEPHMGRLPNNDYGHGIADAYAAITRARFSGTLTGTVHGPEGPIAGARVEIPALALQTETDAAGVYELRVQQGSWDVEVSAYGFVGTSAAISLAAGEEVNRDFDLAAAAVHTLAGTVSAGGGPVAGARVRVVGTPLAPAYTDADGSFTFEVAAGEYQVTADATGFRRATEQVVLAGDRSLSFELVPLPGTVAPGWREYQNNPTRTGLSAEQLAAGTLTRSWSVDLPGQVMFASPVVADGRIHVSFDGGSVTTLDLDDGETLWTFGTGASLRSTPAVANGRVYVGGGDSGTFHALDAATGAPVWSFSTGDRLTYTTPTVVGGAVYFGTGWGTGNGGWVYALDAESGTLRWKTFVGAQIYFAPAVGGGNVYAASYDAQRLVALDAETGSERWSLTRASDSFAAMPSYDAGRLYVATNNFDTGAGSVLAVDAETGDVVWEAAGHGDAAGHAPVVYADLVIAGSSLNNWVVAYDRDSGERRWTHSVGAAVSNSQLGADGVIVGGSQQDSRVWALDAYTGDLLWEDTLSSNVLSAPAFADGRLVVADRFGVIRAYEAPGTVAGTVTDANGAGLDAEIRVVETGVSVRTDPVTGEFELAHRPGTYRVEARAYGYVAASAELTVRSGQRVERTFQLAAAAAGSLRGEVRDEGGGPLAGAAVTLAGSPLDPVTTGDDGAFVFPDVAAGTYTLRTELPGYVTSEQQVTVAAGGETVAAVTLLRYQIAVTGDRDRAITRYLEGKGYRVEATTAAAVADHAGAYELIVANGSQDDPGEENFLRLLANADAAETSVVLLDSWGISYGALLHLSRYTGDPAQTASGFGDGEVSLVARVAHPLTEGLPIGERVPALAANTEWASFSSYSGRSLADVYIGRSGGTVGSGIGYSARTFGSVHVLLSLHAATPWTGPTTGWTTAGAKVFDNSVAYALGAAFGAVEGTVTASDGGPVPAKVTVAETGDATVASADGTYRLLLPPGSYTLRFERIGYTPQERAVEVAGRETSRVDVQLASSGAGGITGIVTSTAGGPVEGAAVTVLDTELEPATTGPDGRFSIDGVPGGTYRVQVSADRFRTEVVEDVVVVDGLATEIAVQLRPALRVAVIGDSNGLRDFLVASEVEATAAGWEAVANLDAYDVLVVNQPTDPGRTAFLEHLEAIDEAGKSAIFLEGNFSTSGGARLLRLHTGDPGTNAQVGTTAGNRYLRPLVAGHPLFAGVTLTNGVVEILAAGRRTGYSNNYSGVTLASFGANNVDLGVGAGYEPRTPTSIRLLLGPLGSHSSASPANGWTESGRRVFLNAIEWAAAPGLGAVAGRVSDAAGDPIASASVRIVETGKVIGVDESGSFLIPHAPGDWTVEASAFGYQTRQLPVRIDAGRTTQLDLELVLGDVGSISGTVTSRGTISETSGEGPPIESALVKLLGHPRTTTTAADGSYTLTNVEPGTYTVELSAGGHVRQRLDRIVVTAGSATRADASLRPSPRVAVIDDCQQNAGCTNKMQGYLTEWGYLTEEIGWTDLDRLGEVDLVVANLGDFPRLDPGAAGLAAFQDAANRAHVPVIWLEQFQRGSIRHLSQHEGDPASVGEGRTRGTVEVEILADHPLVAGFEPGERVPIIEPNGEHTWFNGFSGTTVANLVTGMDGVRGSAIAYRGRTASSVDVLFSSFAVSFYTWPPVGDEPAELLTPQAERLFHNALGWAFDAPPLAAEVRGTVRSSVGGTLPSTVTVAETGRAYPGRAGDGSFLVPLQPGTWTLEVEAFGHEPQQLEVTVAPGTVENVSLTLQAHDVGTVAGTVTDPDGAPVTGASLALADTPLAAESDASGAYRIERVPVGEHMLVVRKSGFGIQRIPVTVTSGATTRADVRLAPSRVVAVAGDFQNRLTDFLVASGYAPVQWSWTNIHQHTGDLDDVELVILNGSGTQPTAANLTTFVEAAAEANRSLVFAGQNGTGSIRTLRTTFGDPATVTQGFVPNAIYYRPSVEHPIFAGFSVGEQIELIVNAPNQQYDQFGGYSGETIATVESATAPLGGGVGFRFATPTSVHLLLGSLAVSSFGSPDARWTENAREIYLNALEWALEAAQAEIHGTVTSGGEPVSDASVTAVEAGAATRTAADGSYRLGVPGGTHTVRITATGYEPFEQTVVVGEEERVRLDAELVPVPRGAIEGVVSSSSGGPLAGVEVVLDGPQGGETATDEAGRFEFVGLLPGDYTLELSTGRHLPRTVAASVVSGETTRVDVELRRTDVAVVGDADGALVGFLRAHDVAAEERAWEGLAADAETYDVLVLNGGDAGAEEFEAVVAAADAAGTSVVFTGTWGVLNGGLGLLARHRPNEVVIGGHGYRDGAVELTDFDWAHPLFAGVEAPARPLADDGYYSFLDRYVGPYLAGLDVERRGPLGISVAYDFRSASSVHLLLSAGAASDFIGPGYGWTPQGERLFLNAVAWARTVQQSPPGAPTLETEADAIVPTTPVTLTGTAEFRSAVTIRRDGVPVAEVEPQRDGSFSVDVQLVEGPNSFTAVAANYAGASPPSAAVTVTLDTTPPVLTWTPADGTGFFEREIVVSGTATDVHAGVAEVLVNGEPASLTGDGNFAAEVTLAPGANELVVTARDRVGNEVTETRRVAHFPYTTRWTVAGAQGQGQLNVFLDIADPAGRPVRVDSARAELVRGDGSVEAAAEMVFAGTRYRASLGRPPAGTYTLRGILVVEGWNVRAAGPVVVRAGTSAAVSGS